MAVESNDLSDNQHALISNNDRATFKLRKRTEGDESGERRSAAPTLSKRVNVTDVIHGHEMTTNYE